MQTATYFHSETVREHPLSRVLFSGTTEECLNTPVAMQCVQQLMLQQAMVDEKVWQAVESALHEAVLNVALHGNLEMEGGFTTWEGLEAYHTAVHARLAMPRYRGRRVTLLGRCSATEIVVEVQGAAPPFSPPAVMPENATLPWGRGIKLMRALTRDITWDDKNNGVTLVFDTH